jgi:hypothetical protein
MLTVLCLQELSVFCVCECHVLSFADSNDVPARLRDARGGGYHSLVLVIATEQHLAVGINGYIVLFAWHVGHLGTVGVSGDPI